MKTMTSNGRLLLVGLVILSAACAPTSEIDTPDDVGSGTEMEAQEPVVLRQVIEVDGPKVKSSCDLLAETAAYEAAWKRTGKDADSRPEVDFDREMVVAVFHGYIRVYDAMKVSIETVDGATTLAYGLASTSGGLSPGKYPWGFYILPRTDTPIHVVSSYFSGPAPATIEAVATLRLGQ